MEIENLTTKNIKDFTPADTIYISTEESRGFHVLFLCQFIKLEKGMVYGTIIGATVNPEIYGYRIKNKEVIKGKTSKCAVYGKGKNDSFLRYYFCDQLGYFDRADCSVEEADNELPSEHPSYGTILASRRSSNGTKLFGSSIQHNSVIGLTISRGELSRDLNYDRIYGGERLIEIEMSQAQFAEFITGLNIGFGVPCTIKFHGNEGVESPPYKSKLDQFQHEFKNKMRNVGEDVKRVVADAVEILENKKTIGKADRDHILESIKKLVQNISSNVPFVASQFNEQMDKTVHEAKQEVESFVMRKFTEIGIKHADELGIMLPEFDDVKQIKQSNK